MKLAIIGIRYTDPVNKIIFNDYSLVLRTISRYFDWNNLEEIVSGGAIGADSLAEKFADDNGLKKKIFLPDWEKYGKKAGFLRNQEIIDYADMILCFWDGVSKGSADSLSKAKKAKKPTLIIYV